MAEINFKYQNFGIEVELTGITRENGAQVIATFFNTSKHYVGGTYDTWEAKDNKGRTWKATYDSSIRAEKKVNKNTVSADSTYKCEIVSPILQYEDIENLQQIIRDLRKAGAIANNSCGIHVHVDGANHTVQSLKNLINIMYSKENMIHKALEVEIGREQSYCRKIDTRLVEKIKAQKPKELIQLENLWYENYSCESRHSHYHSSRYHALNLHSYFNKGTVEFRLFNSTTHAGKIKSYIQFCLAISHQAIKQNSTSAKRTESTNEKYTFRVWLLHLGLIGDEYTTARKFLLENLQGQANHRYAI